MKTAAAQPYKDILTMIRIVVHFLQQITDRLGTPLTEFSFNLDNQRVSVPSRNKRATKVIKRTIYRIDIDDERDVVCGSLLYKGKWQAVEFDKRRRNWRFAERE